MPHYITHACIGRKDGSCVDVCPVDCIHPRKDEPEFAAAEMLFIDPETCIDCGLCVATYLLSKCVFPIPLMASHWEQMTRATRMEAASTIFPSIANDPQPSFCASR